MGTEKQQFELNKHANSMQQMPQMGMQQMQNSRMYGGENIDLTFNPSYKNIENSNSQLEDLDTYDKGNMNGGNIEISANPSYNMEEKPQIGMQQMPQMEMQQMPQMGMQQMQQMPQMGMQQMGMQQMH